VTATEQITQDAFFDAIQAGDLDRIEALLDSDPELLGAKADELTPLMFAVYYSQTAVVDVLDARGLEIDIFAAAALGRLDRVQDLLAQNPNLVHSYSADGWTPLHLAAHFGRCDAATLLLDAGADVSTCSANSMQNQPLHAALAGRSREVAALLLDAGAEVNARQQHGFTALHAAAQNGDLASAVLLLERGANPFAETDGRETALDYAIKGGHDAVADLLRARGAA
jgi:ankyrin repeat protein